MVGDNTASVFYVGEKEGEANIKETMRPLPRCSRDSTKNASKRTGVRISPRHAASRPPQGRKLSGDSTSHRENRVRSIPFTLVGFPMWSLQRVSAAGGS